MGNIPWLNSDILGGLDNSYECWLSAVHMHVLFMFVRKPSQNGFQNTAQELHTEEIISIIFLFRNEHWH